MRITSECDRESNDRFAFHYLDLFVESLLYRLTYIQLDWSHPCFVLYHVTLRTGQDSTVIYSIWLDDIGWIKSERTGNETDGGFG